VRIALFLHHGMTLYKKPSMSTLRSGTRWPVLLLLLLVAWTRPAIPQESPERRFTGGSSVLEPVYGPLAEQIVADFQLTDKKGIGIDLGSGPGDLILELCRRTRHMHWVNADIDARFFPDFMQRAREAGFDKRVSAIYADAVALPFRDNYAEMVVSRGPIQFWGSLRGAIAEDNRVMQHRGGAFIGRGFPEKLPVKTAREIRSQQHKKESFPKYDVATTARDMETIVKLLKIEDYRIQIPSPPGGEDVNYGIWLEFRKASAGEGQSAESPPSN